MLRHVVFPCIELILGTPIPVHHDGQLQVDNAYNEFEGKVVVDLGCGTVSCLYAA